MYYELAHLLRRFSLEDLKKAVGKDICDLVDFLKEDITSGLLIKTAIKGYGKKLLERNELRTLLVANCLNEEQIRDLGKKLKIEISNLTKLILEVGKIPFGDNEKSKIFLFSVGLPEMYLPDPKKEQEESLISLPPSYSFYEQLDYQFDLRMQVLKYFREMENARAILHLPTGAGKTKTAMHILNEYWTVDNNHQGIIIWIAHTEILLRQALSTFINTWTVLGKSEVDIIKFWGKFELPDIISKQSIIFMGIQKLISALRKNEHQIHNHIQNIRMIIIDEAHKAPASETYNALKTLLKKEKDAPPRVLLGLTATPGRKQGYDIEDKRLKNMFDGVKIGIDLNVMKKYTPGGKSFNSIIKYLQYRKVLSTFEREEINFSPGELIVSSTDRKRIKNILEDENRSIPTELLSKLSKSRDRNILIVRKLIELYYSGKYIIFFACNIEHAHLIAAALGFEDISCGLILGETPESTRNELITKFQNKETDLRILINVEVLTTGFDSPVIDCVFIARPISSIILYSQIIGRGIRGPLMGGKERCKLVEVVDDFQLGDESWAFKYYDEYWK